MKKVDTKNGIFTYFIKMLLIFLIIDLIMMMGASIVAESSLLAKYGEDVIMEVFYALAILIVMLLFDNFYVFTERKDNFWTSISLGLPMLLISLINFATGITQASGVGLSKLLNVLMLSIFVGIAEEFLCRGWLQNEFIERFSHNKKETILSIILASLVFGCIHFTNLSFQTLFETILQVINATALGLLLGGIYYKTKNIWSVIFLHSFYDFAIFLNDVKYIKDCTYNTPTLGVTIVESIGVILISIIWILGFIYVINKCEFNDLPFKKKNKNGVVVLLMIIVFVLLLVPFERLVPEYDDYKVCYEYKELNKESDYVIHYPNKKEYVIKKNSDEYYEEESEIDRILNDDGYEYLIRLNNNDTVSIINKNTAYERKLDFEGVENFEVIERENDYLLVVQTTENESTIYYSDSFVKAVMSNSDEYINNIVFKKFELPEIEKLGYITYKEDYPYMLSSGYDEFIIKDGELYLLK